MKQIRWSFLTILGICTYIFIGCAQSDTSLEPEETINQPLVPSATLTYTPTVTSLPSLDRPIPCQSLQTPLVAGSSNDLTGTLGIVLVPSIENAQILLDIQQLQEQILLPSEGIRNIGFSPDGLWFAYQVYSTEINPLPDLNVHLVSSSGENLITPLPLKKDETDGHWFSTWINNEYMLLMYGLPSEDADVVRWAFTVFNPFTSEKQELLKSLPYWNGETAVYFSPDMTQVVYAGRNQEGPLLILWDITQQKELWSKRFINDLRFDEVGVGSMSGFGKIATWAPNSSGFAFTTVEPSTEENSLQYRSYFVGRDGEQEQVLVDTQERKDNIIYEGSWSPNSRYIVSINRWSNTIFLYDFVLDEIVELCSELPSYVSETLWSPDSNNLAFMSEIGGQLHLLVININTKEIVSIGVIQNFFAAGWFPDESWISTP